MERKYYLPSKKLNQNKYEKVLKELSLILNRDGIIIIPTDTIYGFSIRLCLDKPLLYKEVFKIKNRDSAKPMLLLSDSIERLKDLDLIIPEKLSKILKKFWPGPLTVIFHHKNQKLKEITGQSSIGIRIPDNKFLCELIKLSDTTIFSTSANYSGKDNPDENEILKEFSNKVDKIILKKDYNMIKKPSTIIRYLENDKKIELIREGALSFADICKI